ncbi:MAG: hypothetical protein MN733_39570, partial [Nitrososphaera sp.]|nr:hypothetical protein [Nitrososphaera sp.]
GETFAMLYGRDHLGLGRTAFLHPVSSMRMKSYSHDSLGRQPVTHQRGASERQSVAGQYRDVGRMR